MGSVWGEWEQRHTVCVSTQFFFSILLNCLFFPPFCFIVSIQFSMLLSLLLMLLLVALLCWPFVTCSSHPTYVTYTHTHIQSHVTLCNLGVGATFGESILHDLPRDSTVVTKTTCELLRVEQQDFRLIWEVSACVYHFAWSLYRIYRGLVLYIYI